MTKQEIIDKLYLLSQDLGLETALFQEKVASKAGLTVNDMRALHLIMKAHDGLDATTLSKKLAVTNGATTGIIERLAKKDLVHKEASQADRRKVILRANYQRIMENANDYQAIGEAYQELLQSYNKEELQLILDYSRRSLALTSQQALLISR